MRTCSPGGLVYEQQGDPPGGDRGAGSPVRYQSSRGRRGDHLLLLHCEMSRVEFSEGLQYQSELLSGEDRSSEVLSACSS
jgi:hypothetical protein